MIRAWEIIKRRSKLASRVTQWETTFEFYYIVFAFVYECGFMYRLHPSWPLFNVDVRRGSVQPAAGQLPRRTISQVTAQGGGHQFHSTLVLSISSLHVRRQFIWLRGIIYLLNLL